MAKVWEVLSIIIISMSIFRLDLIAAENNSSGMVALEIAWINKPPYTIPPTLDPYEVQGIITDLMTNVVHDADDDDDECDEIAYSLLKDSTNETASEFQMIKLMRENEVQIVFPIFEPPSNRKYSDFHFLKIGRYPGSEYITTQNESNAFSTIVDEVLKSWPLLVLTLVLAAIAGIIMWALVGSVCRYWPSFLSPEKEINK